MSVDLAIAITDYQLCQTNFRLPPSSDTDYWCGKQTEIYKLFLVPLLLLLPQKDTETDKKAGFQAGGTEGIFHQRTEGYIPPEE